MDTEAYITHSLQHKYIYTQHIHTTTHTHNTAFKRHTKHIHTCTTHIKNTTRTYQSCTNIHNTYIPHKMHRTHTYNTHTPHRNTAHTHTMQMCNTSHKNIQHIHINTTLHTHTHHIWHIRAEIDTWHVQKPPDCMPQHANAVREQAQAQARRPVHTHLARTC